MAFTDEDRAKAMASFKDHRRKTQYMKNALFKIGWMHPTELEAYEPTTGIELIAKTMILQCANSKGKNATQVLKEIRDTIGERIGSNWKETKEHHEGKPDILNDLPRPKREPELAN